MFVEVQWLMRFVVLYRKRMRQVCDSKCLFLSLDCRMKE